MIIATILPLFCVDIFALGYHDSKQMLCCFFFPCAWLHLYTRFLITFTVKCHKTVLYVWNLDIVALLAAPRALCANQLKTFLNIMYTNQINPIHNLQFSKIPAYFRDKGVHCNKSMISDGPCISFKNHIRTILFVGN